MPLSPATNSVRMNILAPIGAGGVGEVYRAKDNKLESPSIQKLGCRDESIRMFDSETDGVSSGPPGSGLLRHNIPMQSVRSPHWPL